MKIFRLAIYLSLITLILSACANNHTTTLVDEIEQQSESPSDVYVKMGIEYMRRGKNTIALSKLNKALTLNQQDIKAHNAIAILYERFKQLNNAEYHYKEALRYNPNDSSTNNNYGNFICRQQGIEKAESYFLSAAANPLYLTPELPYTNAGICALHAQKLDQATLYLDKALHINPDFDKAKYYLAELKQQQQDYSAAEQYYLSYIKKNKQNAESLWLGIQISENLGQVDRASSYALLLKSRYPNSKQVQQLQQYYQ